MDQKICKIALLGAGTVGGGTYKILETQKDDLPFKTGSYVEVSKILVRDIEKYSKLYPKEKLVTTIEDILNDKDIKIVVEVMGGIEPAKSYISDALKNGKHVVTANKDLLALHGHELLELARENNCDLLFEAAVAGAIPIIRPMKQCLLGNNIDEVMGIMNGTTNFILTKMSMDNMDFKDALALATELGYAEADPTADVEGHDAGRKLAILASIAFNTSVTFNHVFTEGISKVSSTDIKYAHELGYEIKLIGIARNTPTGVEVHVHPTMISKNHPLASVNDSFNAIFVHGDAVGDAMFYGRGAGDLPTGSAIVGDILDIVRNIEFSSNGRIGCCCYKNLPIKTMEQSVNSYCVRIELEDKAGSLAILADLFGKNDVSISMLLQKNLDDNMAELVIITHDVLENQFNNAIDKVSSLDMVKNIASIIRVSH